MRDRIATRTMGIALVLALFVMACRRDEPMPPNEDSGPTPATLAIPPAVLAHVGPPATTIDDPLTVEGIALGRRLFYDKALSDDQTLSCASCHLQSHGFSDPNTFSTGTSGAQGQRNAMALINLGWSGPLFWDGRAASLEAQVHDPVTNPIEMNNTWAVVEQRLNADPAYRSMCQAAYGTEVIDNGIVMRALAQFERTMISFNSSFDRFYYGGDTTAISEEALNGFNLFNQQGKCKGCHVPGLFTDHAFRNNGLDLVFADPGQGGITGQGTDQGRFKVPTLRNIALTAPYMHDGRFTTLEEVMQHYNGGVHMGSPNVDLLMDFWGMNPTPFSPDEVHDLIALMHSLTDDSFITNPALAEP